MHVFMSLRDREGVRSCGKYLSLLKRVKQTTTTKIAKALTADA